MSTHRLYYDDSFLQTFEARVVSCLPAKPFASASGTLAAWEVLLDESAFYPSSGGQPNDLGCIGEAKLLDVRNDGEEIVHIVDRELNTGVVQGSVLWPRRFDHMQQHTGQHLLSAMFQERFGLPTVSFHLGIEICTIDLRGPEPTTAILKGAERAANVVIFEDRPVNVRYGTADQLAKIGVRKEVERKGILRAIEIEAADLQPCGGTHVKSTGQIGLILVRKCSKIRQDWRVEFACGARAERFASDDFQALRTIAERLSCATEDILPAVEKASAERDANRKSLRESLQQLAEARAELLASAAVTGSNGVRVVAEVFRGAHPDLVLLLGTELARKDKTVALLAMEETGQIVFSQNPAAGKNLQDVLKQVSEECPARGGGTKDFVRAKLVDPAMCTAALELANKLIVS
jgi:alanyl-tRNA synthetase